MFRPDVDSRFLPKPRFMNQAKYGLMLSVLMLCEVAIAPAQVQKQTTSEDLTQISGMYSFEHEGEFVQITVEIRSAKADQTKPLAVTGFISRFADSDSDRGAFLDYFIAKGSLDGNKIVSAKTRQITMKLFPDLDNLPAKAK